MSGVRVPAPPPSSPKFRTRLRRVEPILRRALRGPCAVPGSRSPARTRLLVAVSGGADSTALLIGLSTIAVEHGLELHAAHLDHGLRGDASRGDARFVRELCGGLGIPLAAARCDARTLMRRRGLSGEAGLRTLRREYLIRIARRIGARAIATAHTADDQLETLLLRLGRGTGLRGLSAMRTRHGRWIKPLLSATRAEIVADLERADISWREDASNADRRYARNRVRHDVVPVLARAIAPEKDVQSARSTLARHAARTAREAAGAVRMLEARARVALSRLASIQRGELALDSGGVAAYPYTLRRLILREWWKQGATIDVGLTDRHFEALSSLIASSRGGARVLLPGGWAAIRDRNQIRLTRNAGPISAGPARSFAARELQGA